jgi:hypothetical protein
MLRESTVPGPTSAYRVYAHPCKLQNMRSRAVDRTRKNKDMCLLILVATHAKTGRKDLVLEYPKTYLDVKGKKHMQLRKALIFFTRMNMHTYIPSSSQKMHPAVPELQAHIS